ncbi:MAG: hypothetical protein KIS62_12435 [Ramlibacter sp.]|nr:hypothetical protein [Ramlibacter sp.]
MRLRSTRLACLAQAGASVPALVPTWRADFWRQGDDASIDARIAASGGANRTRTNSAGLIVGQAAPRYDFDPLSHIGRGLKIEPASENFVVYSEDLSNAAWVGSVTASSSAQTWRGVPFWELTKTSSSGSESRVQVGVKAFTSGDHGTITITFMAGTASSASVGILDTAGSAWGLNADSTAVKMEGPGMLVQSVGALWQITGLSATVPTRVRVHRAYASDGSASLYIYPGTEDSTIVGASVFATAAQYEAATFGTSYIPTTAASVPCTGDLIRIAEPSSIGYGPDAFTWVMRLSRGDVDDCRMLASSLYGAANMGIYMGGPFMGLDGVLTLGAGVPVDPGQVFTCAGRFASGDYGFSLNCVAAVKSADPAVPAAPTIIDLGSIGGSGYAINGRMAAVAFFDRPLTDSELIYAQQTL